MAITIPHELLQQISRGNCVLFLGPSISVGTSKEHGLPSAEILAKDLAKRCEYPEVDFHLAKVAQYFELEKGRQALLQYVMDMINDYRYSPLRAHRLIARLPFKVIVTTNYDRLLEQELESRRLPYTRVVRNEEIAYIDERKLLLVKMHGTIDVPSTIVITEDDFWEFFQSLPTISVVLKAFFATKNLLFFGYNLADRSFKEMYIQAVMNVDRHQRRAYAVQREPSAYDKIWWSKRNLQIIEADATDFLEELITRLDSSRVKEHKKTFMVPLSKQPYKFLDYFELEDAPIFYGRDYEIDALVKRVLAHKLTVLYGASGTGKTSLIKAGAMPWLRKEGYEHLYIRALQDPIQSIKDRLQKYTYRRPSEEHILSGERLSDALEETLPKDSRLVLFIDQFEEFFKRQGPRTRDSFIKELAQCLELANMDFRVVLSLREDYFVYLDELEKGLPNVFSNKYRLGNLDSERAQVAIIEPAALFALSFEPELLEKLTEDLAGGGYEPTQLQIVCHRLYEQLSKGQTQFTLADYNKLGSAEGILSRYLDDVLREFKRSEDREVARGVLKSMVAADATKEALSAQEIARDAIVRRLDVHEDQLVTVLETLRNSRVIRKLAEPELYELAHEVLVKKVWEWISEEEITYKYVRGLVRQALGDWQQLGALVDSRRWQLINEHREAMVFSSLEAELMLRTSIYRGEDMIYWFEDVGSGLLSVWEILAEIVATELPKSRYNLVSLLEKSLDYRRIKLLDTALRSEYPALVRQARRVLEKIGSEETQQILHAAPILEDMVFIPAGKCNIGQNESPMQEHTEEPAHSVWIEDFWIGRFPVTNNDYAHFVKDTGHRLPDHWVSETYPTTKEDHPVVYVSWEDASAYCKWLSGREGKIFRLPTEAEWENAASWNPDREDRTVYPYGNEFDSTKCNTAESGLGDTTPIGEYAPAGGDSFCGVSDMAGNVWEWCSTRATDEEDRLIKYPYDKLDGREELDRSGMRVVRGGSFNYSSRAARASARAMRNPDYRGWHYGFRVVCG